MAYIGQSIKNGTFTTLDTSGNTYNGSNTAFALGTQVGSPAQLLVSHDGVIQKPGTDYVLSSGGTAITFTTAPASGASIFIVEISGAVGGPLGSDLNGSELILDADGDTSLHASTDDQIDVKIAGADDFKFSANAMNILSGSTLTIDSGATITNSGTANGFGVTMARTYRLSANLSISADTVTTITANWESVDTDGGGSIGTAMTESSGIFSYPSTGIYFIKFVAQIHSPSQGATYAGGAIQTTADNSTYNNAAVNQSSIYHSNGYGQGVMSFIHDVTNTTNDKVRFQAECEFAADAVGNTGQNTTYVSFIRLGNT